MVKELGSSDLLGILKDRFAKNTERHPGISWSAVVERIALNPRNLASLSEMERTGGEPDVVGIDQKTGQFIYVDCSPESPIGRRSLCYDLAALNSRKQNKPSGSAIEMASAMGIEILSEQQYRDLQNISEFDRKTSSWIATPDAIRRRGGALFCDRRYDTIFLYHNGAESYYAVRGFRGRLLV